jgi:hypothetical protein|nr:hypothetical protein [Neorhizobium tomejilense]
MDWKATYDQLKTVTTSDDEMNRKLFAAVEGWSYPLIGAAYSAFEARSREGSSVDYTGNTEAALAFARELYRRGTFSIDVDDKGCVMVRMGGKQDRSGVEVAIQSHASAPTIAIGILRCTLMTKFCAP